MDLIASSTAQAESAQTKGSANALPVIAGPFPVGNIGHVVVVEKTMGDQTYHYGEFRGGGGAKAPPQSVSRRVPFHSEQTRHFHRLLPRSEQARGIAQVPRPSNGGLRTWAGERPRPGVALPQHFAGDRILRTRSAPCQGRASYNWRQ